MTPIAIAFLAFALMLIAILAGGFIQGKLPEGHLTSDSKEVVKLSMGVMGTLARPLGVTEARRRSVRDRVARRPAGFSILVPHSAAGSALVALADAVLTVPNLPLA